MAQKTADDYQIVDGTYYDKRTPPAVVKVLEGLRKTAPSGVTCRVFLGDPETGKVWPEEYDVYGRISRSTGPHKVPLIVHPKSLGGPQLLDHCILGILTGPDEWSYKHPAFDVGTWELAEGSEVLHNGKVHSRHKSDASAKRLIGFMTGKRLSR